MKLKTLVAIAVAGAFAVPFAAQASADGDRLILAQGASGTNTPIPSAPIGTVSPAQGRPGSVDANTTGSASVGATGSFSMLDANRDGYVSREEAKAWRDANRFSEIDKDGDGRVSQAEWDAHTNARGATSGATSGTTTNPGAGRGVGDNTQPGRPHTPSGQLPSAN